MFAGKFGSFDAGFRPRRSRARWNSAEMSRESELTAHQMVAERRRKRSAPRHRARFAAAMARAAILML